MDLTNIHNKEAKKKRSAIDLGTMVYGKIPPQNKDAEQAILGAILIEKGAFDRASEILTAECFYVEAHQRIFRAMQALQLKGQPIDLILLPEQLRTTEELEMVGGAYYVVTLTNSVVSSAHMENHCRVVYEAYLKRSMIQIGGQLVGDAYEDNVDAFELMEKHEQAYQELAIQQKGSGPADMNQMLFNRWMRLLELQARDHHITGIPSGYNSLDRITHGWQPTDFNILAARPSVGKTAFALNLARNAVKHQLNGKDIKVLFLSLEMSFSQLVDRLIALESETPLDKMQTGKMDKAEMDNVMNKGIRHLANSGIYVDDTAAINLFQFRSKARSMQRKFPNAEWMIIIDYLQLMSGVDNRANREQEISKISRGIKQTAKEMKIPIIALSQLSRAVETRSPKDGNKTPQLSDLRESGAIEQDADMVMFLYRPDYYEINSNADGENTKGLTEVKIAKHRNGTLDTVKLKAELHIQKFTEWTDLPKIEGLPAGGWRPIESAETNSRIKQEDLPFD